MIEVFFDGACAGNPGPAGFGTLIKDDAADTVDYIVEKTGFETNNKAELKGFLAGLNFIRRLPSLSTRKVRFIGDSQYALKAIAGAYKSPKANSYLILEGQKLLKEIKDILGDNVKISWVRAHRKLHTIKDLEDKRLATWNSYVDTLAQGAVKWPVKRDIKRGQATISEFKEMMAQLKVKK